MGKDPDFPPVVSARATDITVLFLKCDRQLLRRRSEVSVHRIACTSLSLSLSRSSLFSFHSGEGGMVVGGGGRKLGTNLHLIFGC